MAQKRFKVVKVYGKKETTFAVDPSASGAAFLFLKAVEASFQFNQRTIERPGETADLTSNAHVMGDLMGKLNFKFELKGSGSAAAAAATAAELDEILTCLFGTKTQGTGTTVVSAGSTTTVVNLTSAAGLSVGMLVNLDCGANGIQPRVLTAIAVNAVTVDHALPSVPANGAACYGSTMYTRANSGHGSMAFCMERDGVQYTALGCKVEGAKIAGVTPKGTALLDISFGVTDWSASAKASLPAATLAGITAAVAPVIKGCPSSIGGTEELLHGFELDLGIKFNYVEALNALGATQPNSINAGLEIIDAQPKGTVKAYFAAGHLTDHQAGTTKAIVITAIGVSAWSVYLPVCQWIDVAMENAQGMIGHSLPFMVRDNGTSPEMYLCVA